MYEPIAQTMSWEEHAPIARKALRIIGAKFYSNTLITPEEAAIIWSYIQDYPDQERDEPAPDQEKGYALLNAYDQSCGTKPEGEDYDARDKRINAHLRQIQRQMKAANRW